MNIYTREFIRHRSRYSYIVIGFLLVIIAFLSISFVSYQRMQQIERDLASVVIAHDLRAELAHTMRNSARDRSLLLLEMSRTEDPFGRDALYMQLRNKGEIFLKAREGILLTKPTTDELALLELQRKYSRIAGPMQYVIVDLLNDNKINQAQNFLLTQAIPAQNRVLKTLDVFIEKQNIRNASMLSYTSQNLSGTVGNILTLTILGTVISFIIAGFVIFKFRSISKLQAEAERIMLTTNRELEKRVAIRTQDLQLANEQLTRLARFDSITHLPNRILFEEVSDMMLSRASRNNQHLFIFFLDLDGFKQVNDNHGHEVGDRILHEVSMRIKRLTRNEDMLARIGGDEFALILSDTTDTNHIARIADKIIHAISLPFNKGENTCQLGVSIGISQFPDDGSNMTDLLRLADKAMYHSKQTGRNRHCFYAEISALTF